jgi:uncharacterized protein YbbK (DUF523 family)
MLTLPTPEMIAAWPEFTPMRPLRLLVSGCLAGNPVGYDGSTYGSHPHIAKLLGFPNVRATSFCPENFSFGTPRALCDIHGGDGHDVLAGRARVLTSDGDDWTAGMISAAQEMLRIAQTAKADLALLMDISAACGSQVIYTGARQFEVYQASQGVCAALLTERGIPVVSQRDFKTLDLLYAKLDPTHEPDVGLLDHHESDWYRGYFDSQIWVR